MAEGRDLDMVRPARNSQDEISRSTHVSSTENSPLVDEKKGDQPPTPAKPPEIRGFTHESNYKENSTAPHDSVNRGSNRRLMPEKTLRKRSSYQYQLEFLVHKKQKDKDEAKPQRYEENIKEKHVHDQSVNVGDNQSSDTPFDIEVIGLSRKKKVYEFHHNKETKSLLRQTTVSSATSQHACNNTASPHEFETRIEKLVVEKVASHIEALRAEMSKKMEEQMKQMFEILHKSKTNGSGSKSGFFTYTRKSKK